MEKIVVVDYGTGNLLSVTNALYKCSLENRKETKIVCSGDYKEIVNADRFVLPGVGAFTSCIKALKRLDGAYQCLHEKVIEEKKPLLGICVGMQIMASYGEEFGRQEGLNWINAKVVPLARKKKSTKIPQIGWNDIQWKQDKHHIASNLTKNYIKKCYLYFVHSYHFVANNDSFVLADCHYDYPFTAVICHENLLGFQFHPEKSQENGQKLFYNFLTWKP